MARKKTKVFKKLNKKFSIQNRLSYTIIAVVALILLGAGVYALTAGGTGNPGHNIQAIGFPVGCASGQYLRLENSQACETQGVAGPCWVCDNVAGGISTPSPCVSGQYLKWTGTAWQCASVTFGGTECVVVPSGVVCPSGYSISKYYVISSTYTNICTRTPADYYECTTFPSWFLHNPTQTGDPACRNAESDDTCVGSGTKYRLYDLNYNNILCCK